MREFFLVALPGLEDLVVAELKDWCPELEIKPVHGGVTVFAPLPTGLALNLVLKTPTRILLRVASFRCRDFPSLYKKTLAVPWRELVNPACELSVTAASRLSRLKIKKRIEETCAAAWIEYQIKTGIKAQRGKKLDLFVRLLNDECTLSLDTSGERLHKRGEKALIGEAPLRETIAAALIQNVGRGDLEAAAEQGVEIVDPMMGSGTFLLEALSSDRSVNRREFAFENFAVDEVTAPVLHGPRPPVEALIGYELDSKTFKAAEGNLSAKSASVQLHKADFFKAQQLGETSRRRWIFCNPPYGERLKIEQPLREYYEKLFEACETVARPDRACFLLPAKAVKGKFVLPWGWKVLEKRPFLNGGIPVIAFLFGRA